MPDVATQFNQSQKGLYRYFGCLECGKKSLVGNLAQRVQERNLPVCHGKNMMLVRVAPDHDWVVAVMKAKRNEPLTEADLKALASALEAFQEVQA